MSRYYGLHCAKCAESSEHWFNHGDSKLREILDNWLAINSLRNTMWIEIEILGGQSEEVFEFLEKHFEHGLAIEDEGGNLLQVIKA